MWKALPSSLVRRHTHSCCLRPPGHSPCPSVHPARRFLVECQRGPVLWPSPDAEAWDRCWCHAAPLAAGSQQSGAPGLGRARSVGQRVAHIAFAPVCLPLHLARRALP